MPALAFSGTPYATFLKPVSSQVTPWLHTSKGCPLLGEENLPFCTGQGPWPHSVVTPIWVRSLFLPLTSLQLADDLTSPGSSFLSRKIEIALVRPDLHSPPTPLKRSPGPGPP